MGVVVSVGMVISGVQVSSSVLDTQTSLATPLMGLREVSILGDLN
ncbi:hypothetical protein [Sulfodiicoccus acidiphilus]|nr:hypothetical protein [Sulfodiicoccus acidiphilus]